MKLLSAVGTYLWRFFVGDSFQLVALLVSFAIVWLLRGALGPADGIVAFVLVAAVIWIDVWRRARGA